jgi:hypothetical protein
MVWMSLVPPLPLLVLSETFEGPTAVVDGLGAMSPAGSPRSLTSRTSRPLSASARGAG